ncbi:hypothetical protein BB561_003789 [Smittium simulii]|uniref:Peptidase S8/S53 domain-containing protein n=1 Tax=Smittium simulii TaxID=133385 RepID=A0A2T9YJM0_9FUNG|nr:hypothetical protein BB561_003789 [Smittium simulii]
MLIISVLQLFICTAIATQKHLYSPPQAPLIKAVQNDGINDHYIISLKKELIKNRKALDKHISFVSTVAKISNLQQSTQFNKISQVYDSVFYGYSATLDYPTLNMLRYSKEIDFIEQDKAVELHGVQTESTWGLNRISQEDAVSEPYSYIYNPNGGKDVNVYVIDTGVNINHDEFEGRASYGIAMPSGENNDDCIGHGTHVAGIIAGKVFGVAKKANIISVKVIKCDGTGMTSDFIGGINWAINDHVRRTNDDIRAGRVRTKSVGNISIGTTFSELLNRAVDVANYKGIFIINSAGNRNDNACYYSPSASALSIVVSSSELNDTRTSSSNFGFCCNLHAPGASIESASIGSNTATAVRSGTSVAAPFVTGIAAIIQSNSGFYPYSYADIKPIILENSTHSKVTNPRGTSNLMAYTIPHIKDYI